MPIVDEDEDTFIREAKLIPDNFKTHWKEWKRSFRVFTNRLDYVPTDTKTICQDLTFILAIGKEISLYFSTDEKDEKETRVRATQRLNEGKEPYQWTFDIWKSFVPRKNLSEKFHELSRCEQAEELATSLASLLQHEFETGGVELTADRQLHRSYRRTTKTQWNPQDPIPEDSLKQALLWTKHSSTDIAMRLQMVKDLCAGHIKILPQPVSGSPVPIFLIQDAVGESESVDNFSLCCR